MFFHKLSKEHLIKMIHTCEYILCLINIIYDKAHCKLTIQHLDLKHIQSCH